MKINVSEKILDYNELVLTEIFGEMPKPISLEEKPQENNNLTL